MAKTITVELTEEEVRHIGVLIDMAMGTPEFFGPSSAWQMLYDSNRIYKKLFGRDCPSYDPTT